MTWWGSSVPRRVARMAMNPGSSPRIRPMSLAVLLVDEDRVGRATLARALLRAEVNVSVIETLDELLTTLAAAEPIDALLIDAAHPEAQAMIETLIGRRPGVAVVARTSDAGRTRALLAHLAVTKFDVRSREAPGEELIDTVKRLVGG
jgi:DNA-binding NtrC family response regulator